MCKLIFKVSFEDKNTQTNRNITYISEYKRSMPWYFVSNGLEMQMPNETFDLLWNSFPNAELTDSETSSSFGEGGKATSSVEKPESNGWRKQDDGYYNNQPNDSNYFKNYYQQKTKQRCLCDVCGSTISCKSNLAKHRRTKKC